MIVAGVVDVEFDIICQSDVTEFVYSYVIVQIFNIFFIDLSVQGWQIDNHHSLGFLRHPSDFCGITRLLKERPAQSLERAGRSRVTKARIQFSSRVKPQGCGGLRQRDFAAPKINNLAPCPRLLAVDILAGRPYCAGFFE